MIIEALVNLVTALLKVVFDLLPNVPQFPDSLLASLDRVMTTIFNNLDLLGIFIRIDTIKILVPLVVIAYNFEHIYHFAIWLVKKIPLSID